jgi:cyclic-di-GMP-binding biofilm dispersal mediator protein
VLAELRERIVEECDYELEASNHRRVERFWRGHPFVLVPTVDTELSRRRVPVSDWVDGMSFDEVTRQPDAVPDRYAQIVYRFFHGTALELGVALGDPHPGSYLLGADGHVAFFDFGMMRRLPPGYLRREAVIAHGVREGEQATVIAGMRELGYLPGEPSEWDGELLLDYMREVSWWLHAEEPLRLAPEDLWRSTEALRDQDARNHILQLRRMTLPPEALPLRRMEGLLFQTAAMMRKRSLGQVAARADRRSRARRRARRPARRLAGPPPPAYGRPVPRWAWSAASGSVSQRFRPVRTPAAIQVHSLRGASVLLCGATGGIGTALALELHSRGAALTLAARNASRLASLPVPGARIFGDLRSAEACTQAVNLAASQTGGLNVLINAVGVVAFGSTAELPTDEMEDLLQTNALVPLMLAGRALTVLRPGGAIVNISGVITEQNLPGISAYGASKAAVRAFDQALAREARHSKVRVIDARPPHIDTGLAGRPIAGRAPALGEGIAPEHVASVICDPRAGRQGSSVRRFLMVHA